MLLFISSTLFFILCTSASIFSLSLMFLYFAFIAFASAFLFLASASLFRFASSSAFLLPLTVGVLMPGDTVTGTSPSSTTEFISSCFLASFSSAAFFCFATFNSLSMFGSVFSAIDSCPTANASSATPIIFLAFISSPFPVCFSYSSISLPSLFSLSLPSALSLSCSSSSLTLHCSHPVPFLP